MGMVHKKINWKQYFENVYTFHDENTQLKSYRQVHAPHHILHDTVDSSYSRNTSSVGKHLRRRRKYKYHWYDDIV